MTAFIILSAWLAPAAHSLNIHDKLDASNVHFDLIDTRNLEGSLGTVGSMIQDKYGFIWIGSDRGLIRFDGHRFRKYTATGNPNDISGTIILDLMLGGDQQLWIATSQGLSRYREKTDDFENFYHDANLRSSNLSSIAWASSNSLLAGTYDGLNIIDVTSGKTQNFRSDPADPTSISSDEINDIFVDVTENIAWISTHDGVTEFNLTTLKSKRHLVGQQLHIRRAIKDSKGNMWFGVFGGGLIKLSPQNKKTYFKHSPEDDSTIASNDIHDILEDSKKNIWVTTDHGGLNLYSEESNNFIRFQENPSVKGSISSNQVRSLFEDKDNNLWVGTFSNGINIFNLKSTGIKNYTHDPKDKNSISHDSVLFLHQLKNKKVLVGTEAGVDIFDPDLGSFTPFPDQGVVGNTLNKHPVLAITEDQNNDLWFGTWSGGAHRYTPSTGKVQSYYPDTDNESTLGSAYVWSLFNDSKNQLWLGTETNGLNKYDPVTDSFERYRSLNMEKRLDLKWAFVSDTIEDQEGLLWISTYVGLFSLDSKTMEFKIFLPGPTGEEKLSSLRTTVLFERKNGDIWVGTQDSGINIIEKNTRKVTHLGNQSGIPSLNIAGIIEDDTGVIWVATADGLIKINESPTDDSENQGKFKILKIKLKNSLPDNTFNRNAVLNDNHGNLYFGGLKGLSIVSLDAMPGLDEYPKVVFSDFYIHHEKVLPNKNDSPLTHAIQSTKDIVLDARKNSFLIQFSALNYKSNALTKYAYRLVGFDKKWKKTTNPFANYTNLNPGTYTFEVQSENSSGMLDDKSASKLNLTIKPVIWLRWWAYFLYIAIIGLLLYFLYTYFRLRINTEMYRELAARDPLTGIYNREGFMRITDKDFRDSKSREHICFILADIDYFKDINDQYGHDIGDQALSGVVNRMKNCIRNTDDIFRWGGEEFLVLLKNTDKEIAYEIAEKIRNSIEKEKYVFGKTHLHLTISIGVAQYRKHESFEDLFKRTDLALYQAKHTGRNTTVLCDKKIETEKKSSSTT